MAIYTKSYIKFNLITRIDIVMDFTLLLSKPIIAISFFLGFYYAISTIGLK